MSDLNIKTIVSAWRDEDFFNALDAFSKARVPSNPSGSIGNAPLPFPQDAGAAMSLLNDDCSMTMIGPHGC
jgi:mersacidin/lichenicidin family type 2 lantibiotic